MIMEETVVKVGIADMNIVKAPTTIRTSGLGSCVGVILYDESVQLAGLVHIMLPESSLSKSSTINKAKYADTAIEELMCQMISRGARKERLIAKIAGGAQMFQFALTSEMMRIGPRNIDAVKKELIKHHIPLVAEDVGGSNGRTIEFSPETGMLAIRTVNIGVYEI